MKAKMTKNFTNINSMKGKVTHNITNINTIKVKTTNNLKNINAMKVNVTNNLKKIFHYTIFKYLLKYRVMKRTLKLAAHQTILRDYFVSNSCQHLIDYFA